MLSLRFRSGERGGWYERSIHARAIVRSRQPPILSPSEGGTLEPMPPSIVTAAEFAQVEDLDHWRYVLDALHAVYRAGSFGDAAALVSAIGTVADTDHHHPDIDLRYPDRIRVVLTTHASRGVTELDVGLARQISDLADRSGAVHEPARSQAIEVAIDTMDADRIRPFWAAVLGYRAVDGVLVDPDRSGPPFWFQQMDEPRAQRSRFHIDVSVPHDMAVERVAAAIAAGGTLVSDRNARSWWILADADGNEVCVCTWQDR
jgi:4a-hydroxytetrahydrobiopterin dehydratase